MRVVFKVETPAVGEEPGCTYHLKRSVEWDSGRAPVPQKDDQVFISGVFIYISRRCITDPTGWDERLEEIVELFATVNASGFKELEEAGWEPD